MVYIRRIAAIALAVMFIMAFAACGNGKSEFNADETLSKLLSEVKYADKLEDISDFGPLLLGDLPEGTEVRMHQAQSQHTDSVIMLKAKDEGDTAELEKAIRAYIEQMIAEVHHYSAEEAAKLENAVISSNGCYIFCCITDDTATARKILG